jgi:hypothetical protein
MDNKFNFPTETIELPSKGLLYPESNPLSSGKVEMKYMTAKEEDILTNQNYLKQGIWLDKLLNSMVVSKIDHDDLLIGDKDALILASRILGYGKDYEFNNEYGEKVTIDLTQLKEKTFNVSNQTETKKNEFKFTLPSSENEITYKLLTVKDEKEIDKEIESLKKIDKNISTEVSTRLKYIILSVNGNYDKKTIRDFVDNALLARDSRALREHISKNGVGIDMTCSYTNNDGVEENITVPVGIQFFWPDA